jgi:molybdopterin synthase catalytic subunit
MTAGRAELTRNPIDPSTLGRAAPEDGALCLFLGVVRNENKGKRVRGLEYEAYEEMAVPLMEQIIHEAEEKWPRSVVSVVHRLGSLAIGETSVAVVATSPHRKEAFEACRFVIDTVKARVPIWKKEFYEDGSAWTDGETPSP